MKFRTIVELPTAEDVVAGLTLRDVHPGLADAEVAERHRAEDLEGLRVDLARAVADVDGMASRVQAGTEPVAALDRAIRERDALALRLAPAETALKAASASREKGEAKARERLRAEGARRNRQLEEAAEQVAPLLEALTSLELALESHVTHEIGRQANLPAVTWPMSLCDHNLGVANARAAVRAGQSST